MSHPWLHVYVIFLMSEMLFQATSKWLKQLTCPAGNCYQEAVIMGRQCPERHLPRACVIPAYGGRKRGLFSQSAFCWTPLLLVCCLSTCPLFAAVIVHLSPKFHLNLSEFGSFRVQLKTRSSIQTFWPLLQMSIPPHQAVSFALSFCPPSYWGLWFYSWSFSCACLSVWLVLPGYHKNIIFCLSQHAVLSRLN